MRALAIKFSWFGFGVALSIAPAPVAADVSIILKDGRVFELPIEQSSIKAIIVDGDRYYPSPEFRNTGNQPLAKPPKAPVATDRKTGESVREPTLAKGENDPPATGLIDPPDEGDLGYFLDEKTGYKWHDIDNFVGMTLSEVLKAIEGTGFHLATRAEVEELQSHIVLSLQTFAAVDAIMGGTFTYRDRSSTPGAKRTIWGKYDDGLPPDTGRKRGTTFVCPKYKKLSWCFRVKRARYTNPALGAFVVNTSIVP